MMTAILVQVGTSSTSDSVLRLCIPAMSSFRCMIIGLLCVFPLASGLEPVTTVAGVCMAVTGVGALVASSHVVPAAGIWGWLLVCKELQQFSCVLGLHVLTNRTDTIGTSKAWIHDDCIQRNIVCRHAWGNEHVLQQRGDSNRSLSPCALRHDFGRAHGPVFFEVGRFYQSITAIVRYGKSDQPRSFQFPPASVCEILSGWVGKSETTSPR